MIMRQWVFAAAMAASGMMVALPCVQAAAAEQPLQQTPVQIVQGIVNQLDRAIDGHRQELQKDQGKLIAVINKVLLPHFDVDYAAILVLGMHARQASPQQRARFAKAFYNSITHRYAQGLLNYSRGKVKVLPSREGAPGDKLSEVRTQVVLEDGKTTNVDYAFHRDRNGQWKAYDVRIEGISYITNYRNQVDAEIRKTGLDQLITNLENQGEAALKALEKNGKASKGH